MKQWLLMIALAIGTAVNAQNDANAGVYMDYFAESSEVIQKDMWDYTKSVSHGRSARKVDKRRKELVESSDKALEKAKKAKDYKGDASYRDAVIEYLTIVNLVLKEDYAKLVDMEAIAEQSYDAMEAYIMARELANDKQKDAVDVLNAKQKVFAEANNINIVESNDKLDNKMEIAGHVYKHYNAVYLIFFKSNKQEFYLMDALGRGDLSGLEQNREALKATVQEGMEKLKNVELYEGDRTMVQATQALFKFYKREAEEDMALAADYFLKSENFQKVKDAFDQKKEKDRTQEDVDQFNNAVNEINAAVNAYNEMNDRTNNERADLIDKWNKAAENFTNKHVPRGN